MLGSRRSHRARVHARRPLDPTRHHSADRPLVPLIDPDLELAPGLHGFHVVELPLRVELIERVLGRIVHDLPHDRAHELVPERLTHNRLIILRLALQHEEECVGLVPIASPLVRHLLDGDLEEETCVLLRRVAVPIDLAPHLEPVS